MKIETTKFESSPSYPDVVHPAGPKARVLLTSVFGPYAQDDEYGSRLMNPMELYHNQVTRTQGPFSLRMFHRSWGIMLIQANIEAPCTLLDFPTLDRFLDEIRDKQYDVIGITSIIPNVGKVKKMCELIRHYQPKAQIIVGGHLANVPDLHAKIDADHIVRGEGVAWFRHYLGEDTGPAHSASRGQFGPWHAEHGSEGRRQPRQRGRGPDSVGRLPAGLQLLFDLGHVRRQGKILQLLCHRRRAFRHHVPVGTRDGLPSRSSAWTRTSSSTASGLCASWN